MEDADDEFGSPSSILQYVKDTALAPVRIATSPTLLRTYLRTALLLLTSAILFAIAVIAYTSFYYAYIPVRGITTPVYLQYDHTSDITRHGTSTRVVKWPYGITNVRGLVSRQKYDIVVEMVLPRSERNLDAGNWMVGLEMRGPSTIGGGIKGMLGWEDEWDVEDYPQGSDAGTATERTTNTESMGAAAEKPVVLARSRRPAILTYRSWMTELAYCTIRLPLYVVGWGQESERVVVQMMEGVEFDKGWRNIPSWARLEIRSRRPLEVYRVTIRFAAKLEGLRWVMYNHRITSLIFSTGMFWGVEMALVLLTWALFSFCFGEAAEDEDMHEGKKIKLESGAVTPKTEPADSEPPTPMSDTSRTFPTLSSQKPLHYSSSPGERSKTKDEGSTPRLEDIPTREGAEADDEDDESADFIIEEPLPNSAAGVLTDSGIGTSLESSVERGLSRRRSGGLQKDG